MRFRYILLLSFLATSSFIFAGNVVWFDGHSNVSYSLQDKRSPVVDVAVKMFSDDMTSVTGSKATAKSNGKIAIYQLDQLNNKEFDKLSSYNVPISDIITKTDAFYIGVRKGRIIVVGSNGRGTAYGILELSRIAGVSPWTWWGDVVPQRKNRLEMDERFSTTQSPSVEYRGIFINDEDWSLRPWSHTTLDKNLPEGAIGPRTYKKIFELLLRLRANTIWPAMHPGTKAFFTVKGNREVADSCDIFVGTSHCEPMLRNNVSEWNVKSRGPYNYKTNRHAVETYWSERLDETKGMDAIYTLGMRGIHDGQMEGVKGQDEYTHMLQKVINDQRKLLKKHINKNEKHIPQVFIPYKEVLQCYENGLHVPEDVTLMWCDDNYGYLTKLSNDHEQNRSGGAGVYYHLSYWGRPHDYLWLNTTQPGLLYQQMSKAYATNARRIWIANVHDPKVAAYDLSLFMDMAWNIDCVKANTIEAHLQAWLCQQFGNEAGRKLLPVMAKYYKLTTMRKPEFMGWSQTELDKKKYDRGLSPATDTEFNPLEFGNELERYLNDFTDVKASVTNIEKSIRPELRDAFFAAVKYPIFAASAMATKQLQAQESRQLSRSASFHIDSEALFSAVRSMKAYQELQQLTEYYNNSMSKGKWQNIMNMNPRNLPVFGKPNLPDNLTNAEMTKYANQTPIAAPLNDDGCIVRNASNYQQASAGAHTIEMLGHSMRAVELRQGGAVNYRFSTLKDIKGLLRMAFIPTQATDGGDIRFSVSIDGAELKVISLKEGYRSEGWKTNVLRGQAIKTLEINLARGEHTLTIKAIDDNIILDQWMIDHNKDREFYLMPIK